MRTSSLLVHAALVAFVPRIAAAQDKDKDKGGEQERDEEDWRFTPKSAADAARVQANQIYPVLLTELRLGYLDLGSGGSLGTAVVEVSIPMPFVIVPGVAFSNIYSFLRIEASTGTIELPMMDRATGMGDIHAIDAAVKHWGDWLAVGAGVATLIPSASDPRLGFGKFAIGPVAGFSMNIGEQKALSISATAEQLWSVAGDDMRDDISALILRPSLLGYLPYAMYVEFEPRVTLDWKKDGAATLRLLGRIGHAVSKKLVFAIEPEWTPVGNGENDFGVALTTSYLP